jgi:uncharacterized protein (DUF433 family)
VRLLGDGPFGIVQADEPSGEPHHSRFVVWKAEEFDMNPLLERIVIDPEVCGGRPCIKGTRIWVALILDFLADDMTESELLAEYPQLAHEDVLAAIAYGAEAARERIVPVPVGRVA